MLHSQGAPTFHHRLLAFLLLTTSALAQTREDQPPPPAFDVASVRPSQPDSPQHSNVPLDAGNVYSVLSPDDARTSSGGLLLTTHQPLWRYISFAYKLSGTQELALRFHFFSGLPTSGAPTWATGGFDTPAEAFDIEARAPANTTLDAMRLMMRSLLADRFHLVTHLQTSDAPVFGLVLLHPGVPGPNLRPHAAADLCSTTTSSTDPPSPLTPPRLVSPGDVPPACGVIAHTIAAGNPGVSYGGRRIPLALLASSLPTMTGMAAIPRPVVDQTGLPGLYDFTLHWAFSPTDTEDGDNAAAFREALKQQLGLALKPTRAPISLLVIDSLEHPSEN